VLRIEGPRSPVKASGISVLMTGERRWACMALMGAARPAAQDPRGRRRARHPGPRHRSSRGPLTAACPAAYGAGRHTAWSRTRRLGTATAACCVPTAPGAVPIRYSAWPAGIGTARCPASAVMLLTCPMCGQSPPPWSGNSRWR